MFQLTDGQILLRNLQERDIADHIRWETTDNEWQLWDGPWDYEGKTESELEQDLNDYIETMHSWVEKAKQNPNEPSHYVLEICLLDDSRKEQAHVGTVGWYFIDDDYCIDMENGAHVAIGVDVPDNAWRRQGFATAALKLMESWIRSQGKTEIYMQTWSGNTRMLGLIEKLGYTECRRKPNFRHIRGKDYDGLTFIKRKA